MSRVIFNNTITPSAPASGKSALFTSSFDKRLRMIDDTGKVATVTPITNFSTTSQSPIAGAPTYLAGSALAIPPSNLQIGTHFFWRFNMTKTAAGTATSSIDVRVGTLGATGDASRLNFVKPAGTAAADEAWNEVHAICRGPLSSSGVFVGEYIMSHNGNTVGHATIPIVVVNTISSAFDVTVANLIVGLSITTGAADAITIQMVEGIVWNL